ncbi:MAG: IclR family transcriptional regulator [Parvibaculaceae bacterium]
MSNEIEIRGVATISSSIVTRSTLILDRICATKTPPTYSQLVEWTGLPKSSVHRLLSILSGVDLIALDPRHQTYGPGPRLIGWAAGILRASDLPVLSTPALEDLVAETGAHACVSILDGTSVLFLKTVDAGIPFRLAPRVGERSPVHACAAGKALLAHLPVTKRNAILKELSFEQFTEHTILKREDLETALQNIRTDRVATCNREEFLQVVGISTAVFDANGDPIAAVSLWDTIDRRDLDDLLQHSKALMKAATIISRRLGYSD